ncbi:hypothetical protein FNF28_00533 [Cafeteria roenbergensis]|uniref:Anoctamin transmembrane domain-containing protein n=1 Tax=Cafeteria roenbergensis TaxID=33653 RepID=A0A5A8E694_CAFRO|nr:hypothetical protein FNF28_00533 [Cafeteria roenbergensis]
MGDGSAVHRDEKGGVARWGRHAGDDARAPPGRGRGRDRDHDRAGELVRDDDDADDDDDDSNGRASVSGGRDDDDAGRGLGFRHGADSARQFVAPEGMSATERRWRRRFRKDGGRARVSIGTVSVRRGSTATGGPVRFGWAGPESGDVDGMRDGENSPILSDSDDDGGDFEDDDEHHLDGGMPERRRWRAIARIASPESVSANAGRVVRIAEDEEAVRSPPDAVRAIRFDGATTVDESFSESDSASQSDSDALSDSEDDFFGSSDSDFDVRDAGAHGTKYGPRALSPAAPRDGADIQVDVQPKAGAEGGGVARHTGRRRLRSSLGLDVSGGARHKCQEVLEALRRAGLKAKRVRSLNRRKWLIKVRAPEWRLEEEAERLRLRMRRRDGGWSKFRRSIRHAFAVALPWDERPGASVDEAALTALIAARGSLFHSSDRQTLIHHILRSSVREGGAELGSHTPLGAFVVQMFPLHMMARLRALRNDWLSIWRPEAALAELDRIGPAPADDTPLDRIAAYFGETVAFYFAWLEFYTQWLVFPALVGAALFVAQVWYGTVDVTWVPLFSLFMALWSTLFLEFWKRRNAELAHRWGVLNYEHEEVTRPQFRGTWRRDSVTGEVFRVYRTWRRLMKYLVTVPVVMACTGAVVVFMILLFTTRDAILVGIEAAACDRGDVAPDSPMCQRGASAGSLWQPAVDWGILTTAQAGSTVTAVLGADAGNAAVGWAIRTSASAIVGSASTGRAALAALGLASSPGGALPAGPRRALGANGTNSDEGESGGLLGIGSLSALGVESFEEWISRSGDMEWWLAMLLPPVAYGFLIPIFDFAFGRLAFRFTDWENHKTESLFRNHRIAKVFVFRFVNSFISLFYYAFSPSSSLLQLTVQLASFLLAGQLWNTFLEVVFPCACAGTSGPSRTRAGGIGVWLGVLQGMSLLAVLTNCAHLALASKQFSLYFPGLTDAQKMLVVFLLEHAVLGVKLFLGSVIPHTPERVQKRVARDNFFLARLQGRRSVT